MHERDCSPRRYFAEHRIVLDGSATGRPAMSHVMVRPLARLGYCGAMRRLATLSWPLVALLGCRDPSAEPIAPVDDPGPDTPAVDIVPLGPGMLEMTVAACAISPDARVWCRDSDLLEGAVGWLPEVGDVEQIWLVDETLCVRSEGQIRCVYPEDPLDPPLPGDAEGRLISPSGRAVIDVAWGMFPQCLIDDEGTAWCRWLPFEADAPLPPLERYPIDGVRDIEIADEIGCMMLADDSVHCFFGSGFPIGSEMDGETLSTTVEEYCAERPSAPHCDDPLGARTDWPAPFRVLDRGRDMAIGSNYACLIDDRGAVGCVTLMAIGGRLNIGGTRDFAVIPGLPPMIEIDGSDDHVCGRSETGEVWCWGSNEFGQLGDGTTTSHVESLPVKVGQWPGAKQISVGFAKSCVVAAEGIECWGWLSTLDGFDATPTEIPGVRASALASREYTTCAREANAWKCWGGETGGLEGATGAAKIVEVSQYVDKPAAECELDDKRRLSCVDEAGERTVDILDVVAVAPGYTDICALVDRRVICLSPSLPSYGRTEFEVPPSTAITGLDWHGCVLDIRGRPHCWADQDHVLEAIDADAKLVAVVATTMGECGLDAAGKVHCWGKWSTDGKPFVLGLEKVVELVGGTSNMCARDRDGAVWCWGRGIEADRPVDPRDPTKIDLPAAQQIVSGFDHVCSLATDGRVSCWGSEIESQRARLSPDFVLRPASVDFF
jgi:hypothetical protein